MKQSYNATNTQPNRPPMPSTIDIPMHKNRLPYLDKEMVEYFIVSESSALNDVVIIRLAVNESNILFLFYAGTRCGKQFLSITKTAA